MDPKRIQRTWRPRNPLLPKTHAHGGTGHNAPRVLRRTCGLNVWFRRLLVLLVLGCLCMYIATLYLDVPLPPLDIGSFDLSPLIGASSNGGASDDGPRVQDESEPVLVGSPSHGTEFSLARLRPLYLGSAAAARPGGRYPAVRLLKQHAQLRIVVTGGAGFIGSHLVDRLMLMGHLVTVVDNLGDGSRRNIEHWMGHPHFEFLRHDLLDPLLVEADQIYHLAGTTAPQSGTSLNPIKTLKTNFMGTINALGLAVRVRARILLASTAAVYGGAPAVEPQPESYWGSVNPFSVASSAAESSRAAETLAVSYAQQMKLKVQIARLFYVYGPRMHLRENVETTGGFARAAPILWGAFVRGGKNATLAQPLSSQKLSLLFVHDAVDALIALMNVDPVAVPVPVNIGHPDAVSASAVGSAALAAGGKRVSFSAKSSEADPVVRADTGRARSLLGWAPHFSMARGLGETARYFSS